MFNEDCEAVHQKGTYGNMNMEDIKCLMKKTFISVMTGVEMAAGGCSTPPRYSASADFAPTVTRTKKMRKPVISGRQRIVSGLDASSGLSNYWKWVSRAKQDEDGFAKEDRRANPDVLPESSAFFHGGLSAAQMIFGEAVEHLQGQQREVYLLLMRDQKSEYEAAEVLGLTRASVHTYKQRAIKFITAYCREAIAKGRV